MAASAILNLGLKYVPSSFLNKTAEELIKKGKSTTKDLGNYINATHIKATGKTKFRIYLPQYGQKGGLIEFDPETPLKKVIQERNRALSEKRGYNKKEIELLINPNSDAQFAAPRLIEKQRAVDQAAKNFDKDKPETWKGLLDIHGSEKYGEAAKTSRGAFFVLPQNKKISKFVTDKLQEASKKTSNVFDENFDPTMTQKAMADLFSTNPTLAKPNMYSSGMKNIGFNTYK